MTAPNSPRGLKKWTPHLIGIGALAGIAWLVIAYVTARVAARPLGEVMSSIGRLEPFTRPLPRGSVVLLYTDTVAFLDGVVVTESVPRSLRIWRGRWRDSTASSTLADTTLVGFLIHPEDSASPIAITLQRSSANIPDSAYLGTMILDPGGRGIRIISRFD